MASFPMQVENRYHRDEVLGSAFNRSRRIFSIAV
jgi:hypothetical protein